MGLLGKGKRLAGTAPRLGPPPPQLPAPTNFVITGGTEAADFSWDAVTGADSYSVQIATNSAFTTGVQTIPATGTTASATGLAAGTLYGRVLASGAGYANSPYSGTASATIAAAPVATTVASTNWLHWYDMGDSSKLVLDTVNTSLVKGVKHKTNTASAFNYSANVGFEPTLVPAGINGLPAIRVSPGKYLSLSAHTGNEVARPFTRIVVLQFPSLTGGVEYPIFTGSQRADLYVSAAGKFGLYSGAVLAGNTPIQLNTAYVVWCEFSGNGNDKLYVNGVLDASGNSGTQAGINSFWLGSTSASSTALIAETFTYAGIIPDPDRSALIAEMMTKYNAI